MTESPRLEESDRVVELAEEFASRIRNGESVSLDDYVKEHADLEDQIRRYFPVVATLEESIQVSETKNAAQDHNQETQIVSPDAASPKHAVQVDATLLEPPEAARKRRKTNDTLLEISEQFGRYRVERLLGQGGMGTVWLALDSQLDRRVALKIPKFDESDEMAIERFYREARSMATVQHSNLCPIYDVGEVDGHHFLTMAYIDGPTLSEFQGRDDASLAHSDTANLVRRLALALNVAHKAGVVHRDLKPANIMITAEGEPVVMDFGLARRQHDGEAEITQAGAIIGSPAYMSPEQVIGDTDRIGPQTDVYALGVILFELLTGHRPFTGPVMLVLGQITSTDAPKLSSVLPDIDAELEKICAKALSRSLEDRYQSAAELAEALDHFLKSTSRDEPTELPSRRSASTTTSRTSQTRIAVRVGLVLAFVAVVIAMAQWLIRTPHGDVVVHAPADAEVRLALLQKGEIVKIVGPDDDWTVEVNKGQYDISLRPMPGKDKDSITSFALKGENTLTVNSGGKSEITIEWKPKAKDGTPLASKKIKPSKHSVRSHLLPPIPQPTKTSTGEFVDSGQRLGNSASRDVKLADFDGDGDLDAFVGCDEADMVWLNDGKGNFKNSGQRLGSQYTERVSVGDLDKDGDFDVVTSCYTEGGMVKIWLNDGTGQFSERESVLPSADHVAVGDLDGDDDLDLFLARRGVNQVFWNDGKGVFEDSGQQLDVAGSFRVTLADFDSDGDLDAYVCNFGDQADVLYINDGTGRFLVSPQKLCSNYSTCAAALDWNGDGSLDLVVCTYLRPLELWLNDGRGQFKLESTNHVNLAYQTIVAGDIDGDGTVDIVAGAAADPSPTVVNRNDKEAAFDAGAEFFGMLTGHSIALGDLDGDGDLDAFAANYLASNGDQVWFNRNDNQPQPGMFVASDQLIKSKSRNVASGDFDGDGDVDLFVPQISGPSTVWLNRGDATFADSGQVLKQASTNWVSAGDLDGDGDLDIFASSPGNSDADNVFDCVWLNDGTGRFKATGQEIGNERTNQHVLADVDSDGDLDMVAVNPGLSDFVWMNDGKALFTRGAELPELPGTQSYDVCVADLDGDGDTDIVISTYGAPSPVRFWINRGEGQFEAIESGISLAANQMVESADVNADGHADLIFGGSQGQGATIHLGDGKGHFSQVDPRLAALVVSNIGIKDLDGDGDLDLLTGTWNRQPDQVLLNDGTGKFSHHQWIGNTSSTSHLADFDGDGDIDTLEVDYENGCRVWLNRGMPSAN